MPQPMPVLRESNGSSVWTYEPHRTAGHDLAAFTSTPER